MEKTDDILEKINKLNYKMLDEIKKIIMGQDEIAQLCLVSLLTKGHVLLEGIPGTGKTLLMSTLAYIIGLGFKRIQFTPDLMPSDILGTNIFNFQKNEFILTKGPIFTEFLLADEINRTPPKTQAALLQAMQEQEVTIDGKNHPLSQIFMVAATQNPIEQEGTYPLPEAQLDRFLFKLVVECPDKDNEVEMVKKHQLSSIIAKPCDLGVEKVTNIELLAKIQNFIQEIPVKDVLIDYIVELVRKTRQHPSILCGASPRAALMLTKASRTLAILKGRDYVIPDDIKKILLPVLGHRIILTPSAQIEGVTTQKVLQSIIEKQPVPR